NTYIFGGPVAPPYLEAICTVCDILTSHEYEVLRAKLRDNCRRLTWGAMGMGLTVLGGETRIISILVGDAADTLNAGNFLFERGYYVKSVTFPAVPYHGGVLRVQVNANHLPSSITGLLEVLADLQKEIPLPRADEMQQNAA